MVGDIEAIFLDVGDTLRILVPDEAHQAHARQQLAMLAGTDESPEAFCARIDARYKLYRKWAFETLIEASEEELWTRWLLPDVPAEKLLPLAGEMTYHFRQSTGRRVQLSDAIPVVAELTRRGYHLGIISNVMTRREIPDWLQTEGLAPYFSPVVLSSIFGRRKPDPAIFLEATRLAGVAPARSAYVGDNPSRDVTGTRRAGFGMAIIMTDPAAAEKDPPTEENKPDVIIHRLAELLDIFPPRGRTDGAHA